MRGLIIIGGPTASGKSDFALRLAEALGGEIINADSVQLYRDLHVLSARPGPEAETRVPHRLYGVLDASDPGSAGRWLDLAKEAIDAALAAGRIPIVVGGTGLYLHALLHGLAPVPDIPDEVRAATRARFERLGGERFHAELARLDPEMAGRLGPEDRQRLMRAHEVVVATGRSLAAWQNEPPVRVRLPEPRLGYALMPPRPALHARVEARLRAMVRSGALDEVRALAARPLDRHLPIFRAVGVPELIAHVEGRVDLETALARATASTRRFAKRQYTWLRHRLSELQPLEAFGEDADRLPEPDAVRRTLLTVARADHSVQRGKVWKPGGSP